LSTSLRVTLTPALSRQREREPNRAAFTLSRQREREPNWAAFSLSRRRERVGVRV
jgi:hypothetical protein